MDNTFIKLFCTRYAVLAFVASSVKKNGAQPTLQ